MHEFQNPLIRQFAAFFLEIGLVIEARALDDTTFLPGLALENGRILVDETKLLYPGDILHEAGHLATTPAADRPLCGGNLAVGGGEEMAAIGWSYAAAVHLGIDPAIVFHPHGYKEGADSLLTNFREGRYLAVPFLQWMGLTYDSKPAVSQQVPPYPHMIRWMRE